MKRSKGCSWSLRATGLPSEASPAYELVVNALGSDKAGLAYMEGRLEKSDTHAKMQSLLVERLTSANMDPNAIRDAVAVLDHIQGNGDQWGWFKKPAKERTAYSSCDESWLWDRSRSSANQGKSIRPQRSFAQKIDDFEKIETGIRSFLTHPNPEPLALLGCLEAVLITRCAVIARATLNALMVALRTPLLATESWWYLDVMHRTGKKRLELRRIFLDPVAGSLAIRWHDQISPLLTDLDTSERRHGMSEKAFRAFARVAGLPREMRTTEAMQAASAWLAVTLPGFLMAVATRRRETHSLPNSAWRRLLGLRPITVEPESAHPPSLNLDELPVAVADLSPVQNLFDLIGPASEKPLTFNPLQVESLTLPEKILADWLTSRKANQKDARKLILQIGHRVPGAIAERRHPFSAADLSNIRAFLTEDVERTELLDLADVFVDWLSSSRWTAPISHDEDDEDGPGVSANILSPREQKLLLEHLSSPACGVADRQLRDILQVILDLGCVGMRRAEALKLRVRDWKPGPSPANYPLLKIEPYKGRRLKSVSSRRYVPAKLLNATLFEALSESHGRQQDEMLIAPYQLTPHSDQTIWLTANRVIQAHLQDPSLHLHHCRHTAATLLLLQLMAAPLGIHRYKGRCAFLDSVLETSEHVADILSLRNPCSLSHLRSISLLLGHLSPLITLKTYIHSCDLLLLFALDRSGEKGYSELLALASGRPLETIKNHQTLPPETRAHVAQQNIPSPRQRTHDGYTILRLVEREFPGAVCRDDTPLSYCTTKTGEEPNLANISELMVHVAQYPTPDEEAALNRFLIDKHQNRQVALPKLRQGLMTRTSADWISRLHCALKRLPPSDLDAWKDGLFLLFQEIDAHRSIIRIRKKQGTEEIIKILQKMDFKVSDWQIRPPQQRGGPAPDFRSFRTWRDILMTGRPLQLRRALPPASFSYEGARWAVLGHLLFLELRRSEI